ncbi:hypothetical protein [Agrococcus sp. Marseille-P2731]|uniref:hypothetical protein n=1 Tax=Agrococcus sp. Marseille-P2731 TaxID=1841862 RepID=UPI001160BE61|nr:hypothetical protein [Agrococcus sp. Marseille-P2731]
MLGRLGSRVALASIAVLLLAGCAPEEPTPEETPDAQSELQEAFDGFYRTVDAQFARGSADAAELQQHATENLATRWAADIQAALDSGIRSRGVLVITNTTVTRESAEQVDALICTDGAAISTTTSDGSTQAPSELLAWRSEFVPNEEGPGLRIAALEPIADRSVCDV